MPVNEAIALLRAGSGTHFDADIVEALVRSHETTVPDSGDQHPQPEWAAAPLV